MPRAAHGLGRDEPRPEALHVENGGLPTLCPLGAFGAWADEHGHGWPLPPETFERLLGEFLAQRPYYLSAVSAYRLADGVSLRLRHVVASWEVKLGRHAPAKERRPIYLQWEEHVAAMRAAAPPSAGALVQVGVLQGQARP